MIQKIIDGIIAALRAAFPEVTRVYAEEVKQGFKEPCFVLRLANSANERFLGSRSRRTHLFAVQYVPKSDTNAKAECYDVHDRLFEALGHITVDGDLRRGTNLHGEYFDGVLTFFANFDAFFAVESELDPMELLTVENQAK
jgi:hypothetical protein